MNEPIRHHYIPQFILKNFCFDDNGDTYYYDKKLEKVVIKKVRDTFMVENLYRDELNSPQCPTQIEYDLAVYESEIAQIIRKKFLLENEITLTLEEDAKLRLFFAIMGFRAKRIKERFADEFTKETKEMYAPYHTNDDFEDFWKRNLSYIVKCRSVEEVFNHNGIAPPIKLFFHRDTCGILGLYFVVIECKGDETFLIGDTYPVVFSSELPDGVPIQLYSAFPISPNRTIILATNGAHYVKRDVLGFRQCVFLPPKINEDNSYTIRVKKVFDEEVKQINQGVINEAVEGYCFKSIK